MTRRIAQIGFALVLGAALGGAEPTPTPPPAAPTVVPAPTPGPRSLAEAGRQIKLRPITRDASGKIVISNTNLPEMAERGAVTSVGGDRPGDRRYVDIDSGEPAPADGETGTMTDDQKRQFWRRKVEGQRQAIQVLEARIEELDGQIPQLWTQYYAWDDPAYRDGVIKVRLDRALAEWEQLKERLPSEQAKLDQILEDARRDGAQPGWFRDLQ